MTPGMFVLIAALVATPPQLEARPDFNLASGVRLYRPRIDDGGQIYLHGLSPDTDVRFIWTGPGDGSMTTIVELEPPSRISGRLGLGPADDLAWYERVSGEFGSAWRYELETGEVTQVWLNDEWDFASWPQAIDATTIGLMVCNESCLIDERASHGVVTVEDGIAVAHIVDVAMDPDSPYLNVRWPHFTADGGFYVLVRLVGGPQQVLRFEADGAMTVIAEDVVGDPESPFAEFQDLGAPAADGRFAMLATMTDGTQRILLYENGAWVEIVTSCVGIDELFGTSLDVDAAGQVCFYAHDYADDGTTTAMLCVADRDACRVIVRMGDVLQSDVGPVVVGALSSFVSKNESGRVVFNSLLLDPDDGSQISDAVWSADGDVSLIGDVTGDGVVNVEDLIEVLAAWGPCPSCPSDLDGDGVVGVADLVIVLEHFER